MENKKISQLDPYSGNPDAFDIPGVADGQTLKTNLGAAIQQKITSERLLSPSDLKTVNGVPLTGQGDIALELIHPFKGWYDSLEGLQTAVGSPAVGDYAYIKGATASDPAAIYECATAGSWSNSGRTVDTSNVQTFETGQAVNGVAIKDLDGNNDPNAAGVLSTAAGKELFENVADVLEGSMRSAVDAEYILTLRAATPISGYIDKNTITYAGSTGTAKYKVIPIADAAVMEVEANPTVKAVIWLLKEYAGHTDGAAVPVVAWQNYNLEVPAGGRLRIPLTNDCKFAYFLKESSLGDNLPVSIRITGRDVVERVETVADISTPGNYPYVRPFGDNKDKWHRTHEYTRLLKTAAIFGGNIIRVKGNAVNGSYLAMLQSLEIVDGQRAQFANGYNSTVTIPADTEVEFYVPEDFAGAMMYYGVAGSETYAPQEIVVETTKKDLNVYSKTDNGEEELTVEDKNGKTAMVIYDGHVITENFNSGNLGGKLPYRRRHFFTTKVNCKNYIHQGIVESAQGNFDEYVFYDDNCVIYLPDTYKQNGTPTKAILYCGEGVTSVTETEDTIMSGGTPSYMSRDLVTRYLVSLGYAVISADGVPDAWKAALKITEAVVGNPVAMQSMRQAWDYAIKHFNIDPTGCYIIGWSQGGHYAQNVIDNTNIPIIAAAHISPALSMLYHQWESKSTASTIDGQSILYRNRLNVARIFGFDNLPDTITESFLESLPYDAAKVVGYDPWTRNVEDVYDGFVENSSRTLYKLPEGVSVDGITMKKHVKCPVKIWCGASDTALGVDVMKVFVKAIQNAGQVAEIKVYAGAGHKPQDQSPIGTFKEHGDVLDLNAVAYEIGAWFNKYGGYQFNVINQ